MNSKLATTNSNDFALLAAFLLYFFHSFNLSLNQVESNCPLKKYKKKIKFIYHTSSI